MERVDGLDRKLEGEGGGEGGTQGSFPCLGVAIRDDLWCMDRLIDWCGGYGSMHLGSLAA